MRNIEDEIKLGPPPIIPDEANYNTEYKLLLRMKDEGETYLWYQRFLIYLRLPAVCRTVPNTQIGERLLKIGEDTIRAGDRKPRISPEWYKHHSKYLWQDRAELYDNYQNSIALKHETQLHDELIRVRRLAEMKAMEKVQERIESIDPDELTANQAMRLLSQLTQTVRKDFGEDSKKKQGTLDDFLKTLPQALAEELMVLVKGDAAPKQLDKPGTIQGEWEEVK